MTKFPVAVELFYDSAWTDITTYAYTRSPIEVERGRADESKHVEAGSCTVTLDNRDGRFSPRNPASPLYGKIGRNTPLRVTLPEVPDTAPTFDASSFYSGSSTTGLSWTHTPAFKYPAGVLVFVSQIVGTTDEVTGVTYGGVAMTEVAGSPLAADAGAETGALYAYFLGEDIPAGEQTVAVSVNGTGSTKDAAAITVAADSTTVVIEDTSTLDSAGTADPSVTLTTTAKTFIAGALLSGHDALASLTPTSPATSLTFPTGDQDFGTQVAMYLYHPDEVASGSPTIGATATSEEAAILAVAVKNGPRAARFSGEVAKWPQAWNRPGTDVYTPVEAAGIMRRLGQGTSPLKSALHRAIVDSDPAAYWVLDDGKDSTEGAPTVGDHPLRTSLGLTEYAQVQPASWLETLPRFSSSGSLKGRVSMPGFTDEYGIGSIVLPGETNYDPFLAAFHQESTGWMNMGLFVESSTLIRSYWTFHPDSGGTTGADFDWTMPADFLDGQPHWWELRLSQSGANIVHEVYVDGVALSLAVGTGVVSSHTLAGPYLAFVGGGTDGDTLGHLALWDSHAAMDGIADAAFGYPGETAGNRISRICGEEGVAFTSTGDLDETAAMGPQRIDTFLDLLRECAEADQGVLYEPRDSLGLAYRTRVDMTNQAAVLELDYTAGVFGSLPEPVDDDQGTRNDVTVKRPDGSSARAVLTEGALSVQAPPDGVGTYDTSVEVNVVGDGFLPNQASWRLALGTVDEARYPKLHLNLTAPAFTGDATLTADAAAVDIGDRVTIDNPPAWLPPDLISVLAQGFTETLGNNEWHIEVNASPESPWQVGEYEAAEGGTYRYDTAGSSVYDGMITGTETSFAVAVDIGPLWTVDDDEFPFDINAGGIRLTVTDIAGATSPQTFTVVQAPVNGINKVLPAGTPVSLWTKARYALGG